MLCPFCGKTDSEVLESRVVEDGHAIRRRRKCSFCGKRFTTFEKVRESYLWVIKKDGRRELFDREKIKRGVLRAIEKRPIPLNSADEIVEQVERELLSLESQEISTKVIGKAVLRRLKKLDRVAWLRFASVYLEFKALEDFAKAMKS